MPTSSACFSSRLRTEICAPRAVSTSSSVARVGLRPSESRTRLEPGKSAAAQRKNAAEEMSPGTAASMAWSALRAGDRDGVERAGEGGAEGAQGQLAVVAGAHGFAHGGGSGGLQAGQQDAGLDLGAGHGRGVVDGLERAAFDGERRVAVGEREARAHGFQRLADALHGAAGERGVADEGEAALLRRQQAGDHAHGGAGVAAVERMVDGVTRPATPVISTASRRVVRPWRPGPPCRPGSRRSRRRWRSW